LIQLDILPLPVDIATCGIGPHPAPWHVFVTA
jgi:hypothetical protein